MSDLPGGDFAAHLRAFGEKTQRTTRTLAFNAGNAVKDGIQNGSAISGAPGQPVDTSFEKNSWQYIQESPDVALIATNVSYAPTLESAMRSDFDPAGVDRPKEMEGGGPHRPSQVGGHHSVKLTRAAWDRIVVAEAQKLGLNA